MTRDKDDLTRKVVEAQKKNILKGDFYSQVLSDMQYLNITETDIILRSEEDFKQFISNKIEKKAFEYLIDKAKNHSKIRHEVYKDLKGSEYIRDPRFSTELKKLVL